MRLQCCEAPVNCAVDLDRHVHAGTNLCADLLELIPGLAGLPSWCAGQIVWAAEYCQPSSRQQSVQKLYHKGCLCWAAILHSALGCRVCKGIMQSMTQLGVRLKVPAGTPRAVVPGIPTPPAWEPPPMLPSSALSMQTWTPTSTPTLPRRKSTSAGPSPRPGEPPALNWALRRCENKPPELSHAFQAAPCVILTSSNCFAQARDQAQHKWCKARAFAATHI